MKSTSIISVSILGMLMMVPSLASAEEASAGATTETTAGGSSASTETSAGATITPPPASAPTLRESPTRRSLPLRENPTGQGVIAPRDVATGQSSGKRMMASGTRPLPPVMEKRMEKRDEMQDRKMGSGTPMIGDQKEVRGGRKAEMEVRMQEKRGEMLKRMSMQMIARMNAAMDRFTKLADRVDSRIAKMKEKGVVTTTAEANIAIVRTKIAEAKAAVALAESNVASAVLAANVGTSTTSNGAGKSVREALQKARTAVQEAHKALVTAIGSLKANVKVDVVATGSAAVTP